ncbi:hypothetical protein SAMN02745866_02142 [Alteromonadaceae bacterium Bs31]|nr:hypothetical protein SAMN02745866_02142 [Alteromonadaceae bacterium Bs31]
MRKNLLFFLLAVSIVAKADPAVTASAVPENLHIYSEAGNAYVDHMKGYCGSSRFVLYADHPKFDAIFSLLLAAQMSQKEVILRFDECMNRETQGKLVGVYLP